MSLRTSNNSQKIKKYNKSEQQGKNYDISLLDTFVWKEEFRLTLQYNMSFD